MEKRNRKSNAETMLVKDVQTYLPLHGRDDEDEQKQLQKVCSGLDHLLALLLQETQAFDKDYSNDGVIASAEISSPGVLELQGLAILGNINLGKRRKSVGFYWEPFAAMVRISETGDLLGYQIKFADAALGLGKVAYNTHPRGWNCAPPEKWMFEFSGPNLET